ncbi:CYTH domain-containing protein [Mangrovimonas sp. YM274]|uniref:CYTH domain-containing protein n=1 Tax=Mangrovimonas sp. YM274 TaxID=3070660 RepID=UPI0027DBE9BA|nr:CYTH domain-containing protein [Mangrovimonas sp. YM274]WMI69135.1 CYTH domain-containing protein [Mangrovimonas sp. YM274]
MIEIERKFLVTSQAFKVEATGSKQIVQGFLNTHKERTVRVRLTGDEGTLTVKGKSSEDGLTRFEWETKISKNEAEALLELCEPGVINKTRYEVSMGKHLFEVDEFHGDNEGLVVAEIELNTVDEDFLKPSWLGREVTGKVEYYNSYLSKSPYKTWK